METNQMSINQLIYHVIDNAIGGEMLQVNSIRVIGSYKPLITIDCRGYLTMHVINDLIKTFNDTTLQITGFPIPYVFQIVIEDKR